MGDDRGGMVNLETLQRITRDLGADRRTTLRAIIGVSVGIVVVAVGGALLFLLTPGLSWAPVAGGTQDGTSWAASLHVEHVDPYLVRVRTGPLSSAEVDLTAPGEDEPVVADLIEVRGITFIVALVDARVGALRVDLPERAAPVRTEPYRAVDVPSDDPHAFLGVVVRPVPIEEPVPLDFEGIERDGRDVIAAGTITP